MTRAKKVILLLSLLIFVLCALYLGNYFYKDYKVESDVSALREIVKDAAPKDTPAPNETEPPKYAQNGMLNAYFELASKNPDMVGWIKIPDTKVDYPVMYSNQSNEYYLHRNFEKEYSDNGLPYLDYQCDLSRPSTNLIIYGHNMRSGAMFAALTKYKSREYYEQHPNINFDTLYEEGVYEIFAVFTTVVGSKDELYYTEFIDAQTPEEFEAFINSVKSRAYYDTGKTAHFGDRLLTLSTCSYNEKNERTVVVARRIR
ncbi:MAG: class B sortase [Clostridiales bacterium]|nr:class B sortase [Clostridiales bacterium]